MKSTFYRVSIVAATILILVGCAVVPKVGSSSPEQVIVEFSGPIVSMESIKDVAASECRKYDPKNTAVFRTKASGPINDSYVFDCVKR